MRQNSSNKESVCMSWNYLLVQGEEFSEKTSSDLPPSVLLKLSLFVEKCSSIGSVIYASRVSRSGTMSAASGSTTRTAGPISNGSGASPGNCAFRADFRVRISARAAKVRELEENAPACGLKWRGSLGKYDLRSRSWKIPRCSALAASNKSSLRWPRWGIMLNGVCWALDISTIPLKETGYGYWGSITKTMGQKLRSPKASLLKSTYGALTQSVLCQMLRRLGLWPTVTLCENLMGWPEGWTAPRPLEMDKFRQWQRLHGKS